MKTLLLATACAVALTATAQAGPTVPEDIRGAWCRTGADGKVSVYSPTETGKCEAEDGIMTIKPDRYVGWEHTCRYTSVKTWFDPNIARSTKSMGVYVSRIDARCGGEGCTWKEQLTAHEAKGALYVTSRHFGERCS